LAEIQIGLIVLELGCGAGLDALIAAIKLGGQGILIGMDFSDKMCSRARQSAMEMAAGNVTFLKGDTETIPLRNGSIDLAFINGILNLNPSRDAIFQELARVVRGGGVAYAAEIILKKSIQQKNQVCDANWFT
jgi:ubiquinone/menaquinone biosynthesis C-methylase UbiE